MWEIHKSGSVRDIEVLHMVKYCGTLDTERQEQQRKQDKMDPRLATLRSSFATQHEPG